MTKTRRFRVERPGNTWDVYNLDHTWETLPTGALIITHHDPDDYDATETVKAYSPTGWLAVQSNDSYDRERTAAIEAMKALAPPPFNPDPSLIHHEPGPIETLLRTWRGRKNPT